MVVVLLGVTLILACAGVGYQLHFYIIERDRHVRLLDKLHFKVLCCCETEADPYFRDPPNSNTLVCARESIKEISSSAQESICV